MKNLLFLFQFMPLITPHSHLDTANVIGKSKIEILNTGRPFKYTYDKQGRYCLTDNFKHGKEVCVFERDTCVEYIYNEHGITKYFKIAK